MNGINGIGGINTSLYLGADAMQTHTIGMQVCAHDVANISTANFLPQREIFKFPRFSTGSSTSIWHRPC